MQETPKVTVVHFPGFEVNLLRWNHGGFASSFTLHLMQLHKNRRVELSLDPKQIK